MGWLQACDSPTFLIDQNRCIWTFNTVAQVAYQGANLDGRDAVAGE